MNLLKSGLSFVFLIGSVQSGVVSAQDAANCTQYPVYQQFKYSEQNMQSWYQRYRAAPSGSFDEQYALKETRAADQQIRTILSPYSLTQVDYRCLESWGAETYEEYRQAPSGSVVEASFLASSRTLYASANQGVIQQLQRYVAVQNIDYFRAEASRLYEGYRQASSGSVRERFYLQAARDVFNLMNQSVARLQMESGPSQQAEQIGINLYEGYRAASSGSVSESAFLQGARTAFQASTMRLQREIQTMPTAWLLSLQQQYDVKFNAAPSGSVLEGFYRQAREMVRQELLRRP